MKRKTFTPTPKAVPFPINPFMLLKVSGGHTISPKMFSKHASHTHYRC